MKRTSWALLFAVTMLATGCAHKQQTPTSGGESGGAAATSTSAAPAEQTATTAPASENLYVTFSFNDIAVTTSGVLRLGFAIKNGGTDPLLCEEGGFTLQLSDGSVLNPDAGAENGCDPDTIDPGSTGKGTMFFDLKAGYAGPVTLIMSDNNTVIGRGTAQIH